MISVKDLLMVYKLLILLLGSSVCVLWYVQGLAWNVWLEKSIARFQDLSSVTLHPKCRSRSGILLAIASWRCKNCTLHLFCSSERAFNVLNTSLLADSTSARSCSSSALLSAKSSSVTPSVLGAWGSSPESTFSAAFKSSAAPSSSEIGCVRSAASFSYEIGCELPVMLCCIAGLARSGGPCKMRKREAFGMLEPAGGRACQILKTQNTSYRSTELGLTQFIVISNICKWVGFRPPRKVIASVNPSRV